MSKRGARGSGEGRDNSWRCILQRGMPATVAATAALAEPRVRRSWIAFRGRARTVNVRSKEEGTFAAIRNDRRGYSRLNDSARNKYCSPGKLSIGYGNWMFEVWREGEKERTRETRERRRKRNRWCSQTILHRVLTVGKSIRDSRFDLYDQIPVAATTARDRERERHTDGTRRTG